MTTFLNSVYAKRFVAAVFLCVFCLSLISGCSTPSGALPNKSNDEAVECDWLLKVDQTIPIIEDELTVNHTLVLIAKKTGGKDVFGTYEGAAFIGSTLDASSLSNDYFDVTGGFDIKVFANNLSFEIVPYEKESYSRYEIGENGVPDVPLVDYESMALLSPEMTGKGIVNPNITGENVNAGYSGSSEGTAPVAVKITVKSGKVHVTIPILNIDRSFEGLLTGVPLGNTDEYQKAVERIDALVAESKEDSGSDSGIGGLIGDKLGTIGSGLELPESFPSDEFPLAPDADILNVYESEDKKNVRVIYATAMEYDDILAFYAPVIEMMETEMDTSTGKMYLGSSDKYASISLMIAETKTKSDRNMVTLDITRK